MQEVFEKINERLEGRIIKHVVYQREINQNKAYRDAIRIVNEVVAEYVVEEYVRDINVCHNGCTPNDLISKSALMEDVRNTITEMSGTMDWLNLINRQPVVSDNGWIPCSERLPEKAGWHLVTTKKGDVSIQFFFMTDKKFSRGYNSAAIAWRPLPEPYKPQKEGV